MSPVLDFVLALAVVVGAAKLGGLAATKLGQPAVLGELLAGLLLGPSALDLTHRFGSTELEPVLRHLAELGVVVLMFLAGLETELDDLRRARLPATLAGTLGAATPLAMALVAGPLFGLGIEQSVFLGLVLAATSVSITARTLMELGALRRPEGVTVLGAAVVDDVLVILGLSVFLALVQGAPGDGPVALLVIFGRMGAFFAVAVAVGRWVLPPVLRWAERQPVSEGVASTGVVLMLLFAWLAEAGGGVAMITGSFLVGLLLAGQPAGRHILERLHPVAYTLLVPVFLVNVGLSANLRAIGGEQVFQIAVLTVVAVVSKVLGCGGGARLGRMGWRQSLRVGCGMVSRGEVGLIIATVGLESGLVTGDLFAVFVVVALITTVVTPLLLKLTFAGEEMEATHG